MENNLKKLNIFNFKTEVLLKLYMLLKISVKTKMWFFKQKPFNSITVCSLLAFVWIYVALFTNTKSFPLNAEFKTSHKYQEIFVYYEENITISIVKRKTFKAFLCFPVKTWTGKWEYENKTNGSKCLFQREDFLP